MFFAFFACDPQTFQAIIAHSESCVIGVGTTFLQLKRIQGEWSEDPDRNGHQHEHHAHAAHLSVNEHPGGHHFEFVRIFLRLGPLLSVRLVFEVVLLHESEPEVLLIEQVVGIALAHELH